MAGPDSRIEISLLGHHKRNCERKS